MNVNKIKSRITKLIEVEKHTLKNLKDLYKNTDIEKNHKKYLDRLKYVFENVDKEIDIIEYRDIFYSINFIVETEGFSSYSKLRQAINIDNIIFKNKRKPIITEKDSDKQFEKQVIQSKKLNKRNLEIKC